MTMLAAAPLAEPDDAGTGRDSAESYASRTKPETISGPASGEAAPVASSKSVRARMIGRQIDLTLAQAERLPSSTVRKSAHSVRAAKTAAGKLTGTTSPRAAQTTGGTTQEESPMSDQLTCPRCGRATRYKHDGIFRWRVCPATKTCGWTVFTHGKDPRDTDDAQASSPKSDSSGGVSGVNET